MKNEPDILKLANELRDLLVEDPDVEAHLSNLFPIWYKTVVNTVKALVKEAENLEKENSKTG